jgi:hypothetical protein
LTEPSTIVSEASTTALKCGGNWALAVMLFQTSNGLVLKMVTNKYLFRGSPISLTTRQNEIYILSPTELLTLVYIYAKLSTIHNTPASLYRKVLEMTCLVKKKQAKKTFIIGRPDEYPEFALSKSILNEY